MALAAGAVLLLHRQDLTVRLARSALPLGDGILLVQVWFAVPVIFVLVSLGRWLGRERDRRAIAAFAWLVAALAGTIAASLVLRPYGDLKTVRSSAICLQSADYSCGAASTVNFLRLGAGVIASEDEMGRECGVIPLRGITMAGAWWGITKKLAGTGLEAEIVRPGLDGLLRLRPPVLVGFRAGLLLDHMVVLAAFEDGEVEVIDPHRGPYRCAAEALRPLWLGEAIVLRPATGPR